ncbi:hypothetical protein CLCR_08805 [Cladophialophora carrionii]|uniref:Uncharacterized protein n=1 Tax=Cladophialophora carrionii TaxID=86049 RepID=A0A1C1CUD9_9EURO|nr:hypothetical protein CLCR_08805 [Cladophialophora carrionii]
MSRPSDRRRALTRKALAICLAMLTRRAHSQVVGCDVLSCNGGADNECTLGNTTSSFIGTTNLTTSISPGGAPVTWTVGAFSADSSGSSNLTDVTFTKQFYLGTPPSLNLAATDDFAGCALFFEGIARSLPLDGVAEYGSVTCRQTLQDACVDDLLAQATRQVQTLRSSVSGGTAAVCSALQSTLEANPPQSCQSTATVTWGSVVAKGAQSAAANHISQTTCHPASSVPDGSNYNIALVETQTVTSEEVSSDIAPFFYSITPVLTVFYSPSGSTSNSPPEAHLSCLKVVEDSNLVQSDLQTNGAGFPDPSRSKTVMAIAVSFVVGLLASDWV